MPSPLNIAVIGSTGSIGENTLKVAERHPPQDVRVVGLAAGSNVERLAAQARIWHPEVVAVASESRWTELQDALRGMSIEILAGPEGVSAVASWSTAQTSVISVVGFAGVAPTLAAISAGKQVALANKETLVAAGSIVMPAARDAGIMMAPIDSEHSAIAQCLRSGTRAEVARIILTASGGPFRNRPIDTFDSITPAEALAHPTWDMGARITIDSATMMNKGFEIMEAAWLYDIDPNAIDVVIHPQSIVHSFVEFRDGSTMAQLGVPDMTIPIAYALFGPDRRNASLDTPRYNPADVASLVFCPPDVERFPALNLARRAFAMGGTAGAVLNAADEIAVAAFLENRISFPLVCELVEWALDSHDVISNPDLDDIEKSDRWARDAVEARIDSMSAVENRRSVHPLAESRV